jgi:hypothetical protein
MYGFILATVVMVAAGFMKPSEDHVSALWEDISAAKTHARALARERSAAGSEAYQSVGSGRPGCGSLAVLPARDRRLRGWRRLARPRCRLCVCKRPDPWP